MKLTYTNTYFSYAIVLLIAALFTLYLYVEISSFDTEYFYFTSFIILETLIGGVTLTALLLPKVKAEKYVMWCILSVMVAPFISELYKLITWGSYYKLKTDFIFKSVMFGLSIILMVFARIFSKERQEGIPFNTPWLIMTIGISLAVYNASTIILYIPLKGLVPEYPLRINPFKFGINATVIILLIIGAHLLKSKKIKTVTALIGSIVLLLLYLTSSDLVNLAGL